MMVGMQVVNLMELGVLVLLMIKVKLNFTQDKVKSF